MTRGFACGVCGSGYHSFPLKTWKAFVEWQKMAYLVVYLASDEVGII